MGHWRPNGGRQKGEVVLIHTLPTPTPGSRYEIPDTQMADEKQLEILQDKANFRSFKPKPFNMREFYDRAGHDIRDMLLSCQFRGEVCSAEDFKVVSESPGAGCESARPPEEEEAGSRWASPPACSSGRGSCVSLALRRDFVQCRGVFALCEGWSLSPVSMMVTKRAHSAQRTRTQAWPGIALTPSDLLSGPQVAELGGGFEDHQL